MGNPPLNPWHTIIGSSAILSIALLGDALIYAVLPVYAENFEVTLGWVGVLLSANRFVRVFAYGVITKFIYHIGARRICFVAIIAAAASTMVYGVGQGPVILLIGRIIWGLAYAALLLITLEYAVQSRSQVGLKVGISRTVQRIGPITVLLVGSWLVGSIGPRAVFIVAAAITLFAIPIIFTLPAYDSITGKFKSKHSLGQPSSIDILFFIQGFGVDGVFAVTISLIFAQELPSSIAVLVAGAILSVRHIGEVIAAPLFGWAGDQFGVERAFLGSLLLTITGFVFIASELTIVGSVMMLVFRGALTSLGPSIIVESISVDEPSLPVLARMQAWRDLGAAFGPLITGFSLSIFSAETQHAMIAIALTVGLFYWIYKR